MPKVKCYTLAGFPCMALLPACTRLSKLQYLRRNMVILIFLVAICFAIYFFLQQPKFGTHAQAEHLEAIQKSPNYRDGSFQNQQPTPALKEGVGYLTVMKKFFFGKDSRNRPSEPLPVVKTNLHTLPIDSNILVWFGHSSYYMQVDNKRILVDPVFSGNASPVNFTTKCFAGTNVYSVSDMPDIDLLVITHDHWDHLDYKTMQGLRLKCKQVVTGLATGAHLQRWGFGKQQIKELDWGEDFFWCPGFTLSATPARHFSGRTFTRNKALWLSLVLTTPTQKLYIGGDSGYHTQFAEIGDKYGPFDLVMLECGQYNEYWKYIHMMPEQVVQAAQDLRATTLLPVHWGKFSLSVHAWDEPIERALAEAEKKGVTIIHPAIGEVVNLKNPQTFKRWWTGIR